ncbi:MAG: hypothetical protein AAFO94_11050, partial [Bacteroidota bacterium]
MDNFSRKQPSASGLIRSLFWIIMGTVAVMVILIFVLQVNEIVRAPKGEIIAENVPIEYLAPFESEIERLNISVGDRVSTGDTLMTLYNPTIINNYYQLKEDLQLETENIVVYEKLLATLDAKLKVQRRKEGDIKTEQLYTTKTNFLEINALRKRLDNLNIKISISKNRLEKDQRLLAEGVISANEFAIRKKAYLAELNNYTELRRQLRQKQEERENISEQTDTKMNSQQLNFLSTEHEYYNTQKTLQEKRMRQQTLRRKLALEEKEMQKRYIVAESDGHVSWLFNSRQDKSFVPKGRSLLKINPVEKERFYARLSVPERVVKDVIVGIEFQVSVLSYFH